MALYRLCATLIYGLASLAVLLLCRIPRSANKALYEHMTAALGNQYSPGEIKQLIPRYWRSVVYEKVDMIMLRVAVQLKVTNKVYVLHNAELLQAAIDRGKGAIIVVSHLGSTQCSGAAISLTFPDVCSAFAHYTAGRTSGLRRAFRHWFWDQTFSPAFGGRIYLPTDSSSTLKAINALRRNGIVMIAGDVIWRKAKGVEIVLMGERLEMPLGSVFLHEKTQAPLYFMETFRRPNAWSHDITINGPMSLSLDDDRATRLQCITSLIEEKIRERPAAWLQWTTQEE